MTRITVTLLAGFIFSTTGLAQNNIGLNTAMISYLTGIHGQVNSKEKIYKVLQPREDLQISMSGMQVMPSMGFTSWAAFKKTDDKTLMQGNLVLTEDQISPVMEVVLKHGIQIISLENHYLWESPKVMFMRIEGLGKENILANAVGKIFKKITATSHGNGNFPLAMVDIKNTSLNHHKIENILHTKGTLKSGVYKVIFDNPFINEEELGINNWASFAGSDKEALVMGDFATTQSILSKVLTTFQNAGFYVVAIHPLNTKTHSEMVYLHYIGIGNTQTLAKGIRTALAIPIPSHSQMKNGFNVYPVINFPGNPQETPSNGNFILNLDISFFNKAKNLYPVIENKNELTVGHQQPVVMNEVNS